MDPNVIQADINNAAQEVVDQNAGVEENVDTSSNRGLIFNNQIESEETQINETEKEGSIQEGQETSEVTDEIDIINLGESQETVKKDSQEKPQIDELKAVKEQNALLTRLLNQIQSQTDSTVQTAVQQEETKKKPEFKDYKADEKLSDEEAVAKFAEDLAEWKAEQTISKVMEDHKAKESLRQQQQEDVSLRETFNNGIPEAEKRYNNKFSESLLNANLQLPVDAMREVLKADKTFNSPGLSHDLVYHLSKRKDVVDHLNNLSPMQAGVKIGSIAQKIVNLKAVKTQKITQTPKPVTYIKPGAKSTEKQPSGGQPLVTLVKKKGGQRHTSN